MQAAVTAITNSPATLAAIGVSNPATEIIYGAALAAQFGTLLDVVPQIIIAPDVGTLYSGSKNKVSDHGGCVAHKTIFSCNLPYPTLVTCCPVSPTCHWHPVTHSSLLSQMHMPWHGIAL